MTKSQFNIKISKELLTRVKRQAMMLGKSLTEHITDLVSKSLSDDYLEPRDSQSINKVRDLEERLLCIESIVSNQLYLSKKLTPFTNLEAINCTKFMREMFYQELEKRNLTDKNIAFDNLLKEVEIYDNFDKSFVERFRDIMISDSPIPWTAKELNDLVGDNKCNCPIRKGLINWTGKIDCPSQQEICDKGEELLSIG